MARIYLTGSGQSQGYHTGSGVLSLPVKLQLRDRDARTGSYPTIARTGDPDFSGKYASFFDDTNTVLFITGQIVYPNNLPTTSKYVSGNIASPSFFQGLTAFGTSSAGIADVHISFNQGQTISPFNENRLYLDNDLSFYATGTASGTLPGFAQKLGSKTILTFDTSPVASTDFFFSTGTLPNASGLAAGVNTSMGYFNWEAKRWEIIGDLTTGSNIDILNDDTAIRHAGLLPFVPSNLRNVSGELFNDNDSIGPISRAHGLPFTNFGFPFTSRYDATGSQMLSMSSSISHPLLIEKVSVEFSASFGPHLISINKYGPAIKQFFLTVQSPTSSSITNFEDTILLAADPGEELTVSFPHGNQKKLVAYGQISLLGGTGSAVDYYRDLNIPTPPANSDAQVRESVTGSYRLEFIPKLPSKNNFAGAVGFADGADREPAAPGREAAQIKIGGRTSYDIGADGRSFIAPIGGRVSSGTYNQLDGFKTVGASTAVNVGISSISSLEKTSPFVLLPSDRLIFGFCNTPNWFPITQGVNDPGNRYEKGLSDANVVLSPGAGKVTLFGSLLRNNLPVEPETINH